MIDTKSILQEANEYIFTLFKEKLQKEHVYHNYQHTLHTVNACKRISIGYELDEKELEMLLLAAWFHDAGYVEAYEGHEEYSKRIARSFLEEKNYGSEQIELILECINATKRESIPDRLLCKILCDADISQIGEVDFFSRSELLRTEWESFDIRHCNDLDWARTQLDFLLETRFQTHRAQKLFGEQHLMNVQEQKEKLRILEKKKEKKSEQKGKSKAQPKRGIETMFRSLYKSHINLSAIADSKANMMINIHSLIISITLTLVGAKFSIFGTSFRQNQIIILPIICLLLTSLFSIIYAILSARPKVTKKISSVDQIKENEASILFFGNFTRIGISEFEKEVKTLMKNEDDLYGNMIKDLYYLGKVLNVKYRLLRISYMVFMVGLILTVAITIFVILYLRHVDKYWEAMVL